MSANKSTGRPSGRPVLLRTGGGQFKNPDGIAIASSGRVYVADQLRNDRVQYFREANPAVTPASLGKVKALFQ
ncbi:MAG TPA: hypothetical protein VMX79_05280 [bacterium]|nr:hypothetical protein [bacterium]